ncbi:MAG: WD40 repeat domain-containing protein [Saprospiraceae bacterium]|nr:WD40 repeat domain-containing protein [Saprospiraceae bacterium]
MSVHIPRYRLQQQLTGHEGALYALSPGMDDRSVLSSGSDGWIASWDLTDPDPGRLIARADQHVYALYAWPSEQIVLAGDMNGGVHWLDLQNPEASRHVLHHKKGTYAFASAGGMLFSGGGDGLLTRWLPGERRTDESLQISQAAVRCLAIHPSGDWLAAGCSDGSICYIDPLRMTISHRILNAHLPSVFSLEFNKTGDQLWSGGRDAWLRRWDVNGNAIRAQEEAAHMYTINALALSPDGTVIATASRDKRIRLWNASSGELVQSLDTVRDQGHRHSVNALYWSPFNNLLISASDDRTICLWVSE